MTLSHEQRRALLDIVTRIEDGAIAAPRVPGPVGLFLRELGTLRARVQALVPHEGQFVRGESIGPLHLTPLAPLRERVESELLGEVASTIAASEELAGVVNVTLWGNARPANRLRNVWLRRRTSVRLSGSYRWFAPRRLTPGTASVDELTASPDVWVFRCLRFVGEEFLASPTAITYRWDTAYGPPDFRTFRVTVLNRRGERWSILPAIDDVGSGAVALSWASRDDHAAAHQERFVLGFLVREPWSDIWTVVKQRPADAGAILGHLITWADHRRELLGMSSPTAAEIGAMQRQLSNRGIATSLEEGMRRANLRRSVAPSVMPLASWTRGLA